MFFLWASTIFQEGNEREREKSGKFKMASCAADQEGKIGADFNNLER